MKKEQINVPKLRFSKFTDSWKQQKFSEFTWNAGKRNKDDLELEPYAVTNDRGFIPQSEAHDDFGYMQNVDRKAYNIVPPKSFAYNPARINVGSIGYYDGTDNVIVSSLYEVFQTADYVDDRFLWHWIKSDIFPKWIEKLQEGSVRLYFYYDKLCECHIQLPSIDEQRQISAFLDKFDTLITLQQRKLDQIKEYKKGLLKKMFPKEGETVPEVRFPGFTGEWERRKLGKLAEVKDSARIPNSEWTDSGVPYIRASDLTNDDTSGVLFISSERYDYYRAKTGAPEQGDVLFNGGGEIGKALLHSTNKPIYVQGGAVLYARTSVSESLDGQFLKTYFETPNSMSYIDIASAGGTMKHFTLKPSLEMPIQFPNIPEQLQLGSFFKSLDTLITLHQRKLEAMKEYKKGLLQQMFV